MEHEQRGGQHGQVENAAVEIAGNVDNQIDVDSGLSTDDELLEDMVRSPSGTFGA